MRAALLLALFALAACDRVFGLTEVRAHDAGASVDVSPDVSPGGDLVAWYTLDAIQNGIILDKSGRNHHATCTSCPMLVQGRHGMAMQFDGVSTMLRARSSDFVTPGGFTIAAWMNVDSATVDTRCLATLTRGAAAADTWKLCIYNGNLLFSVDGGLSPTEIGYPTFSQGVWHHVAARWDGHTAELFVDGQMMVSMNAPAALLFDSGTLAIGGDVDENTAQEVLAGELDDVKLYNRALSDAEIGVIAP